MNIIKGDLIKLALKGEFDVIGHGCNCFCAQKSGIAYGMVKTFQTNDYHKYTFEHPSQMGNINKLGCIQGYDNSNVTVVNCYTQYMAGTDKRYVDYDAVTLCMRKLNHHYKGKHIGLPMIGCGLAGGDWNVIRDIIERELCNCNLTIVEYMP